MKKRVRGNLMKRIFMNIGVFFLITIGLVTVKLPVMAAPANVVADTSLDVSWLTSGETNENIDKSTEIIKKIMEIGLIFVVFVGGIAAVIWIIKNKNIDMDLKTAWILVVVAIVLVIIAIENIK